MAFHTRQHGSTRRPDFVLVQGRASFPWPPPDDYLATIAANAERFGGITSREGRIWRWWMRDFLQRVPIDVAVERIIVWPNADCTGPPTIHGTPLPSSDPGSQSPPKKGTGPRASVRRATRRARRLPHVLLGWVGADGFPLIVPVELGEPRQDRLTLTTAAGLLPSGNRRAALTAHQFSRYTWGQTLRKHTGWLEAEPDSATAT
jgi:hypothetical protein